MLRLREMEAMDRQSQSDQCLRKVACFIFPLETIFFPLIALKQNWNQYSVNQMPPFTFHNGYAVYSCAVLLSSLSKILSSHFSFWSVWKLMKPSAWLLSSENISIEQSPAMCSNLFWYKWSAGHIFLPWCFMFWTFLYSWKRPDPQGILSKHYSVLECIILLVLIRWKISHCNRHWEMFQITERGCLQDGAERK